MAGNLQEICYKPPEFILRAIVVHSPGLSLECQHTDAIGGQQTPQLRLGQLGRSRSRWQPAHSAHGSHGAHGPHGPHCAHAHARGYARHARYGAVRRRQRGRDRRGELRGHATLYTRLNKDFIYTCRS